MPLPFSMYICSVIFFISNSIPGIFGLTATSHGFYFWKAKAENIAKYAKKGIDTTGIREE